MPEVLVTEQGALAPIDSTGYVPVSTVGAQFIEALGPWLTIHLAWYLDALGAMFESVAELVDDQGFDGDPDYVPGYGRILNPLTAEFDDLPYLAQFVGVEIPTTADDATARSLILMEGGQKRGTLGAITAAVKRNLSGTQSCVILERTDTVNPTGYWFVIVVRPSEVVSLQALIDAVNQTKPAGVFFTVVQTDGITWALSTRTWGADTRTWTQAFSIP